MLDLTNPENNPALNSDIQEALSRRYANNTILLVPLKSGNVAIFQRDFQLFKILSAPLDWETLSSLQSALEVSMKTRAAASFYGEPNDHDLARDLRRGNSALDSPSASTPRPRPQKPTPREIEIQF